MQIVTARAYSDTILERIAQVGQAALNAYCAYLNPNWSASTPEIRAARIDTVRAILMDRADVSVSIPDQLFFNVVKTLAKQYERATPEENGHG